MRDNPLHQRVFAGNESRIEPLLEGAFAYVLQRQIRTGLVFGGFIDERLVGVAAMVPPGTCRLTMQDRLAMLVRMARTGVRSFRHLPNILRWLHIWAQHDPATPHWHLGPAAVERELQGQGIGTALMKAICEELDTRRAKGYLETDKPMNVRLYRRSGFEVIAERPVLGVTNWFMLRDPQVPGD